MSIKQEPIYTSGDSKLLQRALLNILVNAIVHNPQDTKITVEIKQESQIEIRVTDSGNGMDKQSIQHLFDRYYRGTTTDTPAGGTGLGMAIVKQIITYSSSNDRCGK